LTSEVLKAGKGSELQDAELGYMRLLPFCHFYFWRPWWALLICSFKRAPLSYVEYTELNDTRVNYDVGG